MWMLLLDPDSTPIIATIILTPPLEAYLVESQGNVLLVMQYRDVSDLSLLTFEIFRVEDENYGCDPARLPRVDALRGHMLYLSDPSSVSLDATDCLLPFFLKATACT